ncbi:MAG: ribbon-helix-helix domain-containing protein [Acidithiobacillus thiooxidans]|nr:ribbon-helix-helix domain-containing protein [Acidithiobacillus thiooxidans]
MASAANKAANASVSEADLTAIVNEAVQWAREHCADAL